MERIYKALHVQTTTPLFLFTAALGEQRILAGRNVALQSDILLDDCHNLNKSRMLNYLDTLIALAKPTFYGI